VFSCGGLATGSASNETGPRKTGLANAMSFINVRRLRFSGWFIRFISILSVYAARLSR
jgi:hypothetical protein